ncbi:MAG: PAS domain S-box protein [Candidatus Baltobacteraceae bacterium]
MEDALFITYPRDDHDLHFMVESAPVPVLVVTASGRIAALNKRAAGLFGYDRYELQLEPVDVLIPARLRGGSHGLLGQFPSVPFVQALGSGRQVCCRCKNGSEVLVEVGIEPFEAAAGSFALVTVIDITERRRIDSLRTLTAEIRREACAEV